MRNAYTMYPFKQAHLMMLGLHNRRAPDTSCFMTKGKPSALATRIAQGSIVAASASVFSRLGVAAARVEDILEAAGIARRTFYKYFTGKEDVLAALYEVATDELLKAIVSGASAKGDTLDAVRGALDVYLDYHVENAALLRVLVEQAIRSDSPLAPGRQRFRKELYRILDEAVRARTGEVHDPMLYAALVSALEGVSLELLSAGATTDDVVRAKRVVHLVMDRVLLGNLDT